MTNDVMSVKGLEEMFSSIRGDVESVGEERVHGVEEEALSADVNVGGGKWTSSLSVGCGGGSAGGSFNDHDRSSKGCFCG